VQLAVEDTQWMPLIGRQSVDLAVTKKGFSIRWKLMREDQC